MANNRAYLVCAICPMSLENAFYLFKYYPGQWYVNRASDENEERAKYTIKLDRFLAQHEHVEDSGEYFTIMYEASSDVQSIKLPKTTRDAYDEAARAICEDCALLGPPTFKETEDPLTFDERGFRTSNDQVGWAHSNGHYCKAVEIHILKDSSTTPVLLPQ